MNISELSGTFVFDMDEVVVNISPKLYDTIRFHWGKYGVWFKDLGLLTEKNVLERGEFKINDWLLKDKYRETEFKLKTTQNVIFENLLEDFFKLNFYSELAPNDFAQRTIMNPSFMGHARVKKVYIVSRINCDEMIPFKEAFIKKWFNYSKIEMILVKMGEKKSDVLKGINWNLYVDDEISNIRDVAENCDLKGKEFLIPRFGYNKMPMDLSLLIREKGGVFNYYEAT